MSKLAANPYAESVNPQWVRLLNLLEMNVSYETCLGTELFTADGRQILDFLSGYCVHNTGHNHPRIVAALVDELGRNGPNMLQSHAPDMAGELAQKLCDRAGGDLNKVFFCSSGSEGVESAIKFSKAKTRREGLLYAEGAFHGLSCGALSLMQESTWAKGFGSLLPGCDSVRFGDLDHVAERLATRKYAAFFLEPIQSEGGIRIPDSDYLKSVQRLCRQHGTLLVIDEVQTGMYRTGSFLASHHFGIQPDIVILAKALSGGLIPVGAVLMTDDVYEAVYHSLETAIVHTSTYSENGLAMRAGLATLQVLEEEHLGERASALGIELRRKLSDALSKYEMVKEVRGLGMLNGIEFTKPTGFVLRMSFEAFQNIHSGLFGQMLVMRLFKAKNVLTQICGNNFLVLKVAPPLVVTEEEIDYFTRAVADVVDVMHSSRSFWSDALALGQRAVSV